MILWLPNKNIIAFNKMLSYNYRLLYLGVLKNPILLQINYEATTDKENQLILEHLVLMTPIPLTSFFC